MIITIQQFYNQAQDIVKLFDLFTQKHNLQDISRADHICYKCASSEVFEKMRTLFENESQFLYQSIISNRRIAYIKLKKPIPTLLRDIYFLELSDQKPDNSQKNGFDHIEIYPQDIEYGKLVQILEDAGVEITQVVRPHHTTHDIKIDGGFLIRLEQDRLIEKIVAQEIL